MSADFKDVPRGRNRVHNQRETLRFVTGERRERRDRIEREATCWGCSKEFTRPKGNTDSLCPKCLGRIS